jgi:hypothetical protein
MSSTNSIFLPFVYDNLSEEYIKNIFESAGIGEVERIDFVSKRNAEQNHQAVYVHFKCRGLVNASDATLDSSPFQPSAAVAAVAGFWAEIDKDGCPKLVYSDPWFWKCLKPRAKKHSRGKNDAPRIRIVLDETSATEEHKPETLLLGGGEGGTTKGMTRAVSAGGVGSAGPVVGPSYEFCAELRTNSLDGVEEDDDDDEYRTQKGDSGGRHVPYYGCDLA